MIDTKVYPCSTKLEDHYSIFTIALKHSISDKNIEAWKQRLSELGWRPHDFLRGTGPRSGVIEESKSEIIPFLPQNIFTPTAQEMTFGFKGSGPENITDKKIIEYRLNQKNNNNKKNNHVTGNLLLSLDPSKQNRIKEQLKGVQIIKQKDGTISKTILSRDFQIEWADLWLFNDNTGLLSFKVQLICNKNDNNLLQTSLDDLNEFNRFLRDTEDSSVQFMHNESTTSQIFWKNLVFQKWLGSSDDNKKTNILGTFHPNNHFKQAHIDEHTRYAKLLIMARVPDQIDGEETFLWNAPITDPEINFKPYYKYKGNNEWHESYSAYHIATINGYPTQGDYMLYDLATCGNEGDSAGYTQNREWQVSPEYLRTILDKNGIEIWEYWRGMALHDSLAYLAYDKNMPITWQAEAYYYPLYAYLYHIKFKLNCFSEDIIDQELDNILQARKIKDEFNKFQNQYWFREMTVDFQGVEITEKLKTAFEIDELFHTVKSEVSEISDFINDKIEKGKQSLIAFAVLAFYPIMYIFETSKIGDSLTLFGNNNPVLSISVMASIIVVLAIVSIRYTSRIISRISKIYNWFYKSYS